MFSKFVQFPKRICGQLIEHKLRCDCHFNSLCKNVFYISLSWLFLKNYQLLVNINATLQFWCSYEIGQNFVKYSGNQKN